MAATCFCVISTFCADLPSYICSETDMVDKYIKLAMTTASSTIFCSDFVLRRYVYAVAVPSNQLVIFFLYHDFCGPIFLPL